jgi:thioredoxin 1
MAENVVHVTDDNFEEEVLRSEKPVLVDFWAAWCGPCRMIAPVIEELANDNWDKMKFVKLNVDENQKMPANYGVMSIPTLIVFEKGEVKKKLVGAMPKKKLEAELSAWI